MLHSLLVVTPYPDTGDAPEQVFDGTVNGFWFDATPLSNFGWSATSTANPPNYGTPGGANGGLEFGRWIDRSGNNNDWLEPVDTKRGFPQTASGLFFGFSYSPIRITGAGGSTTKFYFLWAGQVGDYRATIVTDQNTINSGFRLVRDGDSPGGLGDIILSVGNAAGTGRIQVQTTGDNTPVFSSWDTYHTIEGYWDGAILSLRVDNGTASTTPCTGITAGLSDVIVGALDTLATPTDQAFNLRTTQFIYTKNHVPNAAQRTANYSYFAPTVGATSTVTADSVQTYAALAGVTAETAQTYAAMSGVTADNAQAYVSRESVNADAGQTYSAISGVTADALQSYSASGSVTSDAAQSYLASSGVIAENAQTYSAAQGITSDASQSYGAFESVFADGPPQSYGASEGVAADAAQAYGARSGVQSDAAQSYTAAEGVTADAPQTYAAFAEALTVTADAPQTYGASGPVTADAPQSYSAAQSVFADMAQEYAAFAGVFAESAQAYAAAAGVVADMEQAYAALQGVTADKPQTYRSGFVGYQVSDARAALLYQLALLHGLDPLNPMSTPKGNGQRAAGGVVQTIAGSAETAGIVTDSTVAFDGDLDAWIDALAAEIGLTAPVTITPAGLTAGTLALAYSETETAFVVTRTA